MNVQAPFVRGGAEYLADGLKLNLERYGHQVEVIRLPFKWYPPEQILRHMLAARLLKVDAGEPDLVIALKFPAYLAPFPNKKVWLLHQFRQVYELWDTPLRDLPDSPASDAIRQMIIQADTRHLGEAREVYTISQTVADRLRRYNGIAASGVLYPPLLNPAVFHAGTSGDYFFYPSRIVGSKRQALAIEAMRYVRSDFKLILAGQPETEADGRELTRLIARYGLAERVRMTGWITDEEKARLMAGCYAVLFLPFGEDFGYVTLEAFYSEKPVIILSDAGAPLELVENQVNGLIVEPDARALAERMEQLWAERARVVEMGKCAKATLERLHVDWDHVVERLLA